MNTVGGVMTGYANTMSPTIFVDLVGGDTVGVRVLAQLDFPDSVAAPLVHNVLPTVINVARVSD